MCADQICLGYLLVAILVACAAIIYFGLRYRKSFLEKNMLISAEQVWQDVDKLASKNNFKKSDLLFGILQDRAKGSGQLIIKNSENEIVGRIEFSIWNREYKMWAGDDLYRINFPLTRRRSAILKRVADDAVLATYEMQNLLGKHKFELFSYGTLTSERPYFTWRFLFNYRSGNNLVGMKQEISVTREIGKLAILPSNIPLPIKMFILLL